MSKRLIRIFAPELPDRLATLAGTELNVILYRGNAIFGVLESHDNHTLLLRDFRYHPHRLPLADIVEIIYDQKAKIFPKTGTPP